MTRGVDDGEARKEDTGVDERELEILVATVVDELRTTELLLAAVARADDSGREDGFAVVVCLTFEVAEATVTGMVVLPTVTGFVVLATVTGGALPPPTPLLPFKADNLCPSRIGDSMGAATMRQRVEAKKDRTRRRVK